MSRQHFDRLRNASIWLSLVVATPAFANHISSATVSANCTSFTLTASGSELFDMASFAVKYSVTLTPSSGPAIVISDTIPVTPDASFNFTVTISHALSGLNGSYSLSGTASLLENGFVDNTVTITFTPVTLTCGGACPATIGFWKNANKHPFPASVQSAGLTIGGVTYTEADLYTILNNNGGNAVVILGRQLVGALLNQAAGSKDNSAADVAITTAEALLQANHLNLLTSTVDPGSTLGQALLTQEAILDAYNNADFHTCSEGSGLSLGSA